MKKLVLELTETEIRLLRNATSDLGVVHADCISLQLKIANAIIDSDS